LNYRLMKQATSGSAAAEELYLEKGGLTEVAQWSPDGRALLYGKYMGNEARATDLIWSLPLAGSHQPAALFNGSAYYSTPQVSPDGHFIAFTSDESGRDEVYVTSYPPQGRRWQISQNGGREPRWRRDRKELFFFAADNRLQAVPVKISGSDFEAGPPQPLFYVSMKGVGVWRYDVLPDGQHFLVTVAKDNSTSNITLVTNWTNLLAGK
jgi:eukaryotic-like serine/threonine-protein kinase